MARAIWGKLRSFCNLGFGEDIVVEGLKSLYRRCFVKVDSLVFAAVWALLLALFYNTAFWRDLASLSHLDQPMGLLFFVAMSLVLWLLMFVFLNLLIIPYLAKPLLTLLLVIAAGTAYFMGAYGVVIHKLMIQNVFETDPAEIKGLISPLLVLDLLLLGVLPSLLVWRARINYAGFGRELWRKIKAGGGALLLAIVIILCLSAQFASFFRNHKEVRQKVNPLNVVAATLSYWADSGQAAEVKPIALDARMTPLAKALDKPNLVVLVVGETARADHFSINGYDRPTTPLIARQEIINYAHVYSCGTETAVSVPCMFSLLERKNYSDSKAKEQESVLDVIHRAGVPVLWRDNNSSCKGTCDRVAYEDMRNLKIPLLCNERECFDDVLLYQMDERLAQMSNLAGAKLLVLHQKGSHGPDYHNRYPAEQEVFKPVCKTNQLQNCSNQEVINAFDNTIHYTDFFLNNTIEKLKSLSDHYNTALVYLSDHGESLGENNLYLHGMPYMIAPEAQKHVPFFFWFSSGYSQANGVDPECLKARVDGDYSQDNLFHTLLGLTNVETSVYQPELDMLNGCRH